MALEHLETIFPRAAPGTCQLFTASRYTRSITESPSVLAAAPVAAVPAASARPAEAPADVDAVDTVASESRTAEPVVSQCRDEEAWLAG
eukprot:2948836-Lingulodinium_polyedra.AAC.1